MREKQAFAFRLDPAYLADLGPDFIADLPAERPFRVTFFFTRAGFGYHIGFSDIARGGWRTVICRSADDFRTNASTLFRENYVLAHTQHLKNKDIYEGGSKLVMIMDASALQKEERDQETRRLHKLQRGVIDAFLDVFVTKDGVARHPRVVDYYREDEPIELGPDENMHDDMIEEIAEVSKRRGYILGIGVMSSKRVGINHKEYGVTSTGVVKFAEITMKELGVDMRRDAFSVKLTGGPNGDVAGNAMQILFDRCPRMKLVLVLDGTAALVDPEGASRTEMKRILLRRDLDAFDPKALHVGGSHPLPHRPAQGGAPRALPEGDAHAPRPGGALALPRRVLPRVRVAGLHGPRRPLHPRRRPARDHRQAELASATCCPTGPRRRGPSWRAPTPSSPPRPACSCSARA